MAIIRLILLVLAALPISGNVQGQNVKEDSLLRLLRIETADTNKIKLLIQLETSTYDMAASFTYLEKAMELANKINDQKWKLGVLLRLCIGHRLAADYQKAIEFGLKAIAVAREREDTSGIFAGYFEMISVYSDLKDTKASLEYSMKQYDLLQSGFFDRNRIKQERLRQYYNGLARRFRIQNEMDSSRYYRHLTYKIAHEPQQPLSRNALLNRTPFYR